MAPPAEPRETAAFDLPFAELVHSLASAVAEAQARMDQSSLMVAEMMSGQRVLRDEAGRPIGLDGQPSATAVLLDSRVYFGAREVNGERVPHKLSMMELGFTPTFYQFIDTVIEVRVALRISRQQSVSASGAPGEVRYSLRGAPIDATYTTNYNYNLEAAALFKTKIAPVPAPPLLEERVREFLRPASGQEPVSGSGETDAS